MQRESTRTKQQDENHKRKLCRHCRWPYPLEVAICKTNVSPIRRAKSTRTVRESVLTASSPRKLASKVNSYTKGEKVILNESKSNERSKFAAKCSCSYYLHCSAASLRFGLRGGGDSFFGAGVSLEHVEREVRLTSHIVRTSDVPRPAK